MKFLMQLRQHLLHCRGSLENHSIIFTNTQSQRVTKKLTVNGEIAWFTKGAPIHGISEHKLVNYSLGCYFELHLHGNIYRTVLLNIIIH